MKRNTLPGAKFSQSVPNRKENTNGLKVFATKTESVSLVAVFCTTNSAKDWGEERSFGKKGDEEDKPQLSAGFPSLGDLKTMFLTSQGDYEHRV